MPPSLISLSPPPMAPRPLRLLLLCALAAAGEVEWEDSPALTNAWQSISSSDIDKLVDVFVQGGREVALSRSADGRGPLFWAYEFKSVEALALLMHLESDEEAEDADGKRPRDFFPDGQAELDGTDEPGCMKACGQEVHVR